MSSSNKLLCRVSCSSKQAIRLSSRRHQSSSGLKSPRSLPPEYYEDLFKITKNIVDLQSIRPPKTWQIESLRGEQKGLLEMIKKYEVSGGLLSGEQEKFSAATDDFDDEPLDSGRGSNVLPGTFIEARR